MSSELKVHDWIARRLSQGLDFRLETRQPPQPDSIIFKNAPLIDHWVKDQGPQCLFAGLARMRRPVGGHSFHVVLGFSPPSDCEGKIVYFLRMVNTELSMQILCSDSSVLCGELPHTLSNSLDFAQEQLQNVMLPLVQVPWSALSRPSFRLHLTLEQAQDENGAAHAKLSKDVSSIITGLFSSLHEGAGAGGSGARPASASA